MAGKKWLAWQDLGGAAFLLLVTLAFHWPLITPNLSQRQAYPAGDFYDQFYTFASYKHDRLWSGQIPLWNPYTFAGHPFLADVQSAVFYPPGLLTMLFSGPGVLAPQWLIGEAVAHVYLGALLTFLLVRYLTASFSAWASMSGALISALTFALGGYLTGYPPLQLAILETQIWLPLILLLLDLGLTRRRWRWILGAGAAWGVALLAGHPQSAMYLFYCALAYSLFRAWQCHVPWRWAAGANLAWAGVGVGLAAVQLWPAWEFMRLSVRSSLSYQELAAGFGLRDLAQYALPGLFTHWSPVYVGILPLSLALWALLSLPRSAWAANNRGQVFFWSSAACLSLLLSLGDRGLIYRLFYYVLPGFGLFRSQERAIYITSLALSILAGYGWIKMGQGLPRRVVVVWGILSTMALACAGAAATVMWTAEGGDLYRALLRWAVFSWAAWAVVGLVQVFAGRGRPYLPHRNVARLPLRDRILGGWGVLAAAAGIVVLLIDLFTANAGTNLAPGSAASRIYDRAWLAPIFQDRRQFRILNDWGLPGNVGCWLRLEDWAGASPLRLQVHRVMVEALPRWRLWQLFDVGYVATWEHDLPGPPGASRVAMQGAEWAKDTAYVHRLEPDFARAWIVHQARQASDLEALALLADPRFDPWAEVILPEAGAKSLQDSGEEGGEATGSPDVAQWASLGPEEIEVQTQLSASGWLVLGEWYYPGWQVWVDGRRETLQRVDYGLRAVALPAGAHTVVFRFRPASFYAGASLSVLTMLLPVLALGLRMSPMPGRRT